VSKVFANIALSLDGYMTPEGMTMEHWDDPGFKDWGAKWGAMMSWLIGLEHFRSSLKIGPGGETGPVNEMVRHTSERIGANIMGRRMFEAGERGWPEEAPPYAGLGAHPQRAWGAVHDFIAQSIEPGSTVRTDGLPGLS